MSTPKKNIIKKTLERVSNSSELQIKKRKTQVLNQNVPSTSHEKDNLLPEEIVFVPPGTDDNELVVIAKESDQPDKPMTLKGQQEIHENRGICQENEPPPSRDYNKHSKLSFALADWAIENSISHRSLNSLLRVLLENGVKNLPTDSRTLLNTPRKNEGIVSVAPGFYNHFGIHSGVTQSMKKYFHPDHFPEKVLINVNIDGLPLSKSSGSQFWPILGSIVEDFQTDPFIIGVYHGYSKPENPNDFLKYFVEEMKSFEAKGIEKIPAVNVELNAIICDSPSRAYVTCTKGHNAYFGCGKCIQEGEYVDGRVTFPEINATLRTDNDFENEIQEEYHKQASVLKRLHIGMITNFPLDYMHLCCLGVMKRMLQFWVKGSKNIRMNKDSISKVSVLLKKFRPFIPIEFCRKPRSIEEVDRFKATEFRQILLYTGLVVLKDNLKTVQYVHFLCFSLAIRILVSKEFHLDLNDYAHSLLLSFVTNYPKLYGEYTLSYNVHNLVHLCADVRKFGELDLFSAFKYENFMQNILKKVKTSNRPLQQLSNRVIEESRVPIFARKRGESFPLIIYHKNSDRVKHLDYSGFIVSATEPNRTCILKNGDFGCIKNINVTEQKVEIKVEIYRNIRSLFLEPCDSKKFDIVVIKQDGQKINSIISEKDIKQKCLKLPLVNQDFVVIPLIHQRE